jgi:hypothetical protein
MSYIRMGQSGTYVDIPYGSQHYIYGDGETISGWTEPEFAAVVFDALDEADVDEDGEIRDAFADHFGGIDEDYIGGIAQPERAEIFCQCVDSRIEGVELVDGLLEAMQDSFDRDDYIEECEYCGTEFRPFIRSEPYVCSDDECDTKWKADRWNVDAETVRESNRLIDDGKEEEYKEHWDAEIAPNIDGGNND